MSTVHDRMRLPWLRGARLMLPEVLIPVLVLIGLGLLAMQGPLWTALSLSPVPVLAQILKKRIPQRCFVTWAVASVILPIMVFELSVVPMLEILPSENTVLIVMAIFSFLLVRIVWLKAHSPQVLPSVSEDTGVSCAGCHRRVPISARHCIYCRTCSVGRLHHCLWIDCCIGEYNRRIFILALVTGIAALVYGSILILTSVCRPFFWLNMILLPYDCSDAYHDAEIALCFVSALYTSLMALYLLILLVRHCWTLAMDVCFRRKSNQSHDYLLPAA